MRFLYFYLMRDVPGRVRTAAPRHASYWRELELHGYLGGPFADRSGGLIVLETESGAAVEALVADDPFLREHLLERHWVKSGCRIETAWQHHNASTHHGMMPRFWAYNPDQLLFDELPPHAAQHECVT